MSNVPFVVLIVMDGWGIAPAGPGNAISQAYTPNFDKFWSAYPHTQLAASGEAVGLPKGEVGSTETGHLNLGAGSIVYQDLPRINMAIQDGSFFQNQAFLSAVNHARQNGGTLHIMGLLGSGEVHASVQHLYTLLQFCKKQKFDKVSIHIFTDGRDSPPREGLSYIEQLQKFIQKNGVGQVVSVMGRYWAMDRDQRWDRTAVAYFALTQGRGQLVSSIKEAIKQSYENGITDEFIRPIILAERGKPVSLIEEGDAVIFYNFRIDRPRQLTRAFVLENFDKEAQANWGFDPYTEKYYKKHVVKMKKAEVFNRGPKIKNLFFVTMTEYDKSLNPYLTVAFPPQIVKLPLGEVLSNRHFRQLRLAESEKERFVTFYFNGQRELPFPGESKIIIPSPKVPTYDKKPEMSARDITATFLKIFSTANDFRFVLINFANPDMVGHTGVISAAKKACEVVDECIGKIVVKANSLDGIIFITADHGNAEEMLDPHGKPDTEHNANKVPFIAIGKTFMNFNQTPEAGILADVAPTILKYLGLEIPSEMTGRPLV